MNERRYPFILAATIILSLASIAIAAAIVSNVYLFAVSMMGMPVTYVIFSLKILE